MKGRQFLVLVLGLVLAACGHTPVAPTSTPSARVVDTVTPLLAVRIDSLGSAVAIAALSEVVFDATGTPADKLRYDLQFGDGESATSPVASHVYATPGTYTATLTITDGADRQTSTSAIVAVKAVQGTWLYTGFNERTRRFEVRRLSITSQERLDVRGGVFMLGSAERTFTGRLSADRALRITLDDGSTAFEGIVPSAVNDAGTVLSLAAHGGSADGQTLPFTAVAGDPVGPPPDAVLNMRFFSFAAPFAVQGFSPILFDGSASRGEGLTQFIEFGDGESAVGTSAVHPIAKAGHYTSRFTVVDRFGRADYEERRFEVISLVKIGGADNGKKYKNSITETVTEPAAGDVQQQRECRMTPRQAIVPLALLFLGLAACDHPTPTQPTAPTLPTVTALTITAVPSSFAIGQSVQLKAFVTLPDGTEVDATSKVTWQSSDATVATASATGILSIAGFGDADVTATLEQLRGTAHVVVSRPLPTPARDDISGVVHETAPTEDVPVPGATVGIHFVGCPSCPHDNQTTTTDSSGGFTLPGIDTAGFTLLE